MQLDAKNRVTLDLCSSRDSITRISALLSEAFEKLDLPEEATFDLKLAATEALVNAVEHGNKYDERKMIRVNCEARNGAVIVRVRDEGDGFDPAGVPDPTLPENILKEHGRGIFLMRNLCDDVCYNEKGNEVTIVKKIPKAD